MSIEQRNRHPLYIRTKSSPQPLPHNQTLFLRHYQVKHRAIGRPTVAASAEAMNVLGRWCRCPLESAYRTRSRESSGSRGISTSGKSWISQIVGSAVGFDGRSSSCPCPSHTVVSISQLIVLVAYHTLHFTSARGLYAVLAIASGPTHTFARLNNCLRRHPILSGHSPADIFESPTLVSIRK